MISSTRSVMSLPSCDPDERSADDPHAMRKAPVLYFDERKTRIENGYYRYGRGKEKVRRVCSDFAGTHWRTAPPPMPSGVPERGQKPGSSCCFQLVGAAAETAQTRRITRTPTNTLPRGIVQFARYNSVDALKPRSGGALRRPREKNNIYASYRRQLMIISVREQARNDLVYQAGGGRC